MYIIIDFGHHLVAVASAIAAFIMKFPSRVQASGVSLLLLQVSVKNMLVHN